MEVPRKNCRVNVYLVPDETTSISFVFLLCTLQTYIQIVGLSVRVVSQD